MRTPMFAQHHLRLCLHCCHPSAFSCATSCSSCLCPGYCSNGRLHLPPLATGTPSLPEVKQTCFSCRQHAPPPTAAAYCISHLIPHEALGTPLLLHNITPSPQTPLSCHSPLSVQVATSCSSCLCPGYWSKGRLHLPRSCPPPPASTAANSQCHPLPQPVA